MKPVDQVGRGVANFFDAEIRPSLSGGKAILYGVVVGRVVSNAQNLIQQYAALLSPLGLIDGNMVDVEGIAAELRKQMDKSGGSMMIRIMNDEFKFTSADVDSLLKHIERA